MFHTHRNSITESMVTAPRADLLRPQSQTGAVITDPALMRSQIQGQQL